MTIEKTSSAGRAGGWASARSDDRPRVGREQADQAADAGEAGVVVGLVVVDGPADRGVHRGAAEVLVRDVLADRRLDQSRAGQVEARALGHQHGVAEDRQIRPPRDAVAHDRGDLRDAPRRQDGVVAEDPAEVVVVGEDLVLHRQEHARGVDQVDQGQAVPAGDLLGAEDLLDRHREARARLDRRVVGDDHHAAADDPADPRDHPRPRRPAPLVVHLVAGPEAQLQERRAWVGQGVDPLAGRLATLGVLPRDRLGTAPLADRLFFGEDAGGRLAEVGLGGRSGSGRLTTKAQRTRRQSQRRSRRLGSFFLCASFVTVVPLW